MSVTIILPTYNEEENISAMVESLRTVSKEWKILVVDGGSTDRTVELARRAEAEVFIFPERGKGKAIAAAFLREEADQLVLLDADMSYPPSEIPKLLARLDECEVVVGSRFSGSIEKGAMSGVNSFGNRALTFFGNLLYGGRITDLCSGLWAFRKDAYKNMKINAPHFELEANFFSECMKKRIKLCEVPISYRRRGGKAKISIMDGLRIGGFLISKRF